MKDAKAMDFTEHKLSSKIVYSGTFLRVVEDEVRLPDGGRTRREYIRHPGAVMILPFLDRDTVLLVRQYRYPVGRHFEEIPAGKINEGEEPLKTAQRELQEECGYQAKEWRRVATLHPCIGYSNEAIELFLARDLMHVGAELDVGEFLEVMPVALPEAVRRVRDGRITDAKTAFALLWADKFRDA